MLDFNKIFPLLAGWGSPGGSAPLPNLYFNPEMAGGTDFVAGVGTFPDFHVASNNDNTIDATYHGEGAEPSYTFNPNNNTGRLAFRQIRSTTDDLVFGHRYRFSADVWIDQYDGSSIEMLRGVNVNNNAALSINRDNADHSGTNGEWNYCEVLMDVIGTSTLIYLAHGCGVINSSDITSEYRNIALNDLGPAPATVIDQPFSDITVAPGAEKIITSTWQLAVRYQWYFDDDTENFRAITDGQTYQGTDTDTLTIQSMSAATEGRYICVGFNMVDERTDSEVAIIRMPNDFDTNDFLDGDFAV